MKMAEASSLLVGMDASVANAAAHVRYADPYHFSQVFKERYGTASAHFRMHPRSTISDKRRAY
jgi:AraC-like DNA-binding protein